MPSKYYNFMSNNRNLWITAAASAVVAGGAWLYQKRRFSKSAPKSPKLSGPTDVEGLVEERFQKCVEFMGPTLPKLPQKTQLDFYGLYKQATLGDADDKTAPPMYDVVKTAKYNAWKQHRGLDRAGAMQKYIDKAILMEFTKAAMAGDDDDDDMEGPIMDMGGMGLKPSTMASGGEEIDNDKYPLHRCARENDIRELESLLLKGLSPDSLDASGQTALHLAADSGHPDCIKLLFKFGANVNASDHDGISVLQAAVIGGNLEVCKLLCTCGANPDQPDTDGDTPRDCAKDDPELAEMLFRASQGSLQIDEDFQKELQQLGRLPPKNPGAPQEEDSDDMDVNSALKKLDDNIEIDFDDDGDM